MKLLKLILSISLIFVLFSQNLFSQNGPMKDKFYLGAFQQSFYHPWIFDNGIPPVVRNFPKYNDLSFNMMHSYGFIRDYDFIPAPPWTYRWDGGFYDPVSYYEYNMNNMLYAWNTHYPNSHSLILERHKILRPAYGQRSTYQAEIYDPNGIIWIDKRPGYGYSTHSTGTNFSETWQGETVRGWVCCNNCPDASPGAYMVTELYENYEQANMGWTTGKLGNEHDMAYNLSDKKDVDYRWYVKPRMRIDQTYANNPANWENNVVRIEIVPFSGEQNKITQDIKVKNFLDDNLYYNGSYKEVYNFYLQPGQDYPLSVLALDLLDGIVSDGMRTVNLTSSQIDYRVYWYGDVDVWLDYVRVDDEWAHFLFEDPNGIMSDYRFHQRIEEEVNFFKNITPYPGAFGYFYMDEQHPNTYPCIAEVNRIIKTINPNSGLLILFNDNYLSSGNNKNPILQEESYEYLISTGAVTDVILTDIYPFEGVFESTKDGILPHNVSWPSLPGTQRLRNALTAEEYNYHLNDVLDNGTQLVPWYHTRGYINRYKSIAQTVKEHPGIIFHLNLQTHSFESNLYGNPSENMLTREPTMEEISMQAYIGLAYGAQNISEWIYQSYRTETSTNPGEYFYDWGMLDLNQEDNRTTNYYGQEKWNGLVQLNQKIKNLGDYMFSTPNNKFNWQSGYSVHNEGANHEYIQAILSVDPRIQGSNPCIEDGPYGIWADCLDATYWEMCFFTPSQIPTDGSKYFFMVNKRCTPDNPIYNNDEDIRALRIRFNPEQLLYYNTWKIYDVMDSKKIYTFQKSYQGPGGYVFLGDQSYDAGYFLPGEGKLFKLEPVPPNGGIMLADEVIPSGSSFYYEDTLWTNNYNLTIENGVTIHFSDSAKFVVEGGTFQIGDDEYSGPNNITMDAAPSNTWKGFEFNGATVKIYGVNFSGLANDSISMLSMLDCPLIDLRNNSFSLQTGNNKSAIDIAYVNQMVYISNAYIGYNTFSNSSTELPYVKVMAYSGFTTPIIVESNSFTGTSTALFLNNIQGGVVKSNSFTGFGRAVTALTSSLDVYDNTITSTQTYGLEALSGTELKMSYAGGLLVGGKNNITNSDSSSYNIYLENSYFLMNDGENIFDVGYGGYHLYGWFPDSYGGEYGASENCFKVAGTVVDPPVHYVTLGEQGNQITDFEFTPYLTGCTQEGGEGMLVINLGDGIYDTVGILGQGGSYSSNYIITPKTIYDSISISMRFRNYVNVKSLCLQLLNTYPDSMQSLGAVSKLYLSVSKTDTTAQGITDLKTLYENLILNHSNNISLVKRCNYYIQKCKVLLHQYSSALTGFQQIINNNPASYEGLVARWDYMATSLLMQGQGGSERETSNVKREKNVIPLWGGVDVPMDIGTDGVGQDDDRSPFTKEERKQIKQAVNTALELSKYTEEKREKVLTELSTRGDVNATRQLKVLRSLEQTVKVEKPKNISEHLKIVAGDIQKVFVNPSAGKNTNRAFIPQEFILSQNYPNPFNPTTKISYDIPKNSIVKLTIYDILGREVMKLVNNEFKQPGRYIVEFNGTNLASGVYFYRLESGDFVASKKMILVK